MTTIDDGDKLLNVYIYTHICACISCGVLTLCIHTHMKYSRSNVMFSLVRDDDADAPNHTYLVTYVLACMHAILYIYAVHIYYACMLYLPLAGDSICNYEHIIPGTKKIQCGLEDTYVGFNTT